MRRALRAPWGQPMNDQHQGTQQEESVAAAKMARGWAFIMWMVAMTLPLLGFVVVMLRFRLDLVAGVTAGSTAVLFGVLFCCAALATAAGFLHRYLLRRYWQNGVVTPRGYLIASTTLWSGITAAAIVALIGCLLDGSLFPNIVVAGLMVLLLTATWPNGRPMTHRRSRSDEDDDEELLHLPEEDETSR